VNSVLFGAISVGIGWTLNEITQVIKHRRDRNDAVRERRETFELETLTSCSEALLNFATAAAAVVGHTADSDSLDDAREKYLVAPLGVRKLVPMILDDKVRTAVDAAVTEWASTVTKQTTSGIAAMPTIQLGFWAAFQARLNAIGAAQQKTNAAHSLIGDRVRGLYKGTVTKP
jgi:hypothetical protein